MTPTPAVLQDDDPDDLDDGFDDDDEDLDEADPDEDELECEDYFTTEEHSVMTITLEPTDRTVQINGVEARVWQGHTARGIPMHAFIVRCAVSKDEDASEFAASLQETAPLRPELAAAIPLRMVL